MLTTGKFIELHQREIWSVAPDASVLSALTLMAKHNIGAVLVLDNGKLAGIFSERDYARKVILQGKNSHDTRVSEIMTSNVITVNADQKIEECMQIMTDKHVRHLPVLKDGSLFGMISIGDVVREMIAEQKDLIQQLHSYIAS